MERVRRKELNGGGAYFSAPKRDVDFIPSGSKMLDLALGGGWAERRIANIVGDKSSGKTLLCIEASANFAFKYPKGKIRYREAESAFLPDYAEALGMPIERIDFGGDLLDTIEDFYEDLEKVVKAARYPELYIVDSLDALSDRSEMAREIDEGSYGTKKAAKMSELFRRLTRQMSRGNVTLIVVSQIRTKIGVSFGKQTTRSGGRALDFYASQVAELAQLGRIMKTISNLKRPVGVEVLAKIAKNKIALPYREARFDMLFGYGIDDGKACLDWLASAKRLRDAGVSADQLKEVSRTLRDPANVGELHRIHGVVERVWFDIERELLPKQRKYGGEPCTITKTTKLPSKLLRSTT